MSKLSSKPLNFQRFLDLQRSTSRSLSPENELRQMTFTTSVRRSGSPHREASPLTSTAERGGPLRGRSTSTTAAATPSTSLAHADVRLQTVLTAARTSRAPLEEACAMAARWQYGSPLYDPPQATLYCWNHHPMELATTATYAGLEGVTCDFCGVAKWMTAAGPTTAEAEDHSQRGSAKGRKNRARKVARTEKVSGNERLPFYHCNACSMDLCTACAEDIRQNERFHRPCASCTLCGAYVSLNATQAHACEGPEALESTAPQVLLLGDVGEEHAAEKAVEVAPAEPSARKGTARRTTKPKPSQTPPAASPAAPTTDTDSASASVPREGGRSDALARRRERSVSTTAEAAATAPTRAPENVEDDAPTPVTVSRRSHKSKEEQQRRAERRAAREAKKLEAARRSYSYLLRLIWVRRRDGRPVPESDLAKLERLRTTLLDGAPQPAPVPAPFFSPLTSLADLLCPRNPTASPSTARYNEDELMLVEESFELGTRPTPAEGGWQLVVQAATEEERAEVQRMAAELNLMAYPTEDEGVVLFTHPTRLSAERTARRAQDGGLRCALSKA